MTNSIDKCTIKKNYYEESMNVPSCLDRNQLKRKQFVDNDISQSSIFDILGNEFQIGDILWAKLPGFSWWPTFVYGCFYDDGNYVKVISKPGLPIKKQYFVYCFGSHFKHAWVHETYLHRYEGLEEFVRYSEHQVEQASSKRTEEKLRKKFKVQISEELHPLWKEAVDKANELLTAPMNLRINVFQKLAHRLINGTKFSLTYQNKEQVALSDNSNNEEQQLQQSNPMLSSLCNLPKRTVANKQTVVTSEVVEKNQNTMTLNSIQNHTTSSEQSTKVQSKSFQISTTNELDNDIVVVRLHRSISSSSVSLTTAICHYLDKGIPSLTLYEEICLVDQLVNHRLGASLTLTDAQLYVEQYVIHTALRNFHHKMLYVQNEYFYEFLLKYPQIILKHRQWFQDFQQTLMPIDADKIQLKKWQLATLLHAHCNLEQC
ncbi:hypothetical protein I4U23_001890 [Adineta vaga]|nr:hypothetical protein I4U23_001890 [Adineta vaga]